MEPIRLRRTSSAVAALEARLQERLADAAVAAQVEAAAVAAVLAGSLELAEQAATRREVEAALEGAPAPESARRLVAAYRAVPAEARLGPAVLAAWHAALGTPDGGWRTTERTRSGGAAPAPPAFVLNRLRVLEQWLAEPSAREIAPGSRGALVLARVMEIVPFESGNGQVARLAAGHAMRQAGGRLPCLQGADRPRLDAALQAAYRLHTEPLATLLEEAAERTLDVMAGAAGLAPSATR